MTQTKDDKLKEEIKIRDEIIGVIRAKYIDFPKILHEINDDGTSGDLVIDEIVAMSLKKARENYISKEEHDKQHKLLEKTTYELIETKKQVKKAKETIKNYIEIQIEDIKQFIK